MLLATRILVHRSIARAFTAALRAAVAAMYGASQVLVQPAGAARVAALLADASRAGAAVHPDAPAACANPCEHRNVVVTGVTADMALWRTESFGPVVLVVEFDTEAEAVALANDSEYGLSAGVWTRDLARGIRVAKSIESGLKSNTSLVTMLNGLVVPAVRSHEAPVREGGLRCLGLSCLLDRTLAEENLTLFAHCFNKGHDKMQVEALHIISDILLTHGAALLDSPTCSVEPRQLYKMLAKATRMADADDVQATAVEVLCKLMLAQVVRDEELLKVLVAAYFSPDTAGNQSLRQTLSYFLPVFCHCAAANARAMASVAVSCLHHLLAQADPDMVAPPAIAAQLLEWTDPRKTAVAGAGRGAAVGERVVDATPHALIARDALARACAPACPREERKLLVAVLGKCYIPREAGRALLTEVYENVAQAIDGKVVADVTGRNVLARVEVAVGKLLADIHEEEGGEMTLRTVVGADGDDEEEEEEEGADEMEVEAGAEAGQAPGKMLPDEGEESEHTPNVTEDEDDGEDE